MRSKASQYHPDLARPARLLPRSAFTRRTMPIMRWLSRLPNRHTPRHVRVVDLGGGVALRLHNPRGGRTNSATLLWIHGGGYVIGSAAQDDRLCARYADKLGIPVAAVEYRLAPEHPYPAALDDCHRAYTWLTEQSDIDAARIIVAGASAGGGLTAALTLRLHDEGTNPLAQHLVYPMLDHLAADTESSSAHRMWNTKCNRLAWDWYLGDADPDVAVPARRGDVSGLPRTWIGVGTLDPLHREDLDYAARLSAAGVACTLEVVEGAFHGFDAVLPSAGVSRAFFTHQCDAIREAIGSDPRPQSIAVTD